MTDPQPEKAMIPSEGIEPSIALAREENIRQRRELERHRCAVESVVSRIQLRNFLVPMQICAVVDGEQVMLRVIIHAPDRDSGEPIQLNFNDFLPLRVLLTVREHEKYLIERVHSLVNRALRHEVDEAFHVDGKRIYDPHPSEVKPPPPSPLRLSDKLEDPNRRAP